MTAEENTDLQSARRTMDKEIEALRMMEDELNGNLSKALDLMQSTKGDRKSTRLNSSHSH